MTVRPAAVSIMTCSLLLWTRPHRADAEGLRQGGLTPVKSAGPQTRPGDDRWYDARQLTIEGKGWEDTEAPYDRLPARAKELVSPKVWGLSRNSAGLCVRFATDATQIGVRWTLTSATLGMAHMAATGVSGVDLYLNRSDGWHWIAVGKPFGQTNELKLAATRAGPGTHEYLLYLPLYNGVSSLEIGLPASAGMFPPAPRTERPICVYGTSIVQGGCASRPGMAHVAILGRRLDWPTINLGFSGSGNMEPAMASLLGELEASVYVLDCLPNMSTELVMQRVEPFVETLRKLQPKTPIVLVESVIPQAAAFLPKSEQEITAENAALRKVFDRLRGRGIQSIFYVPGEPLLGDDGEGTVDGIHPTDLGFLRMADALEPTLRRIVRPNKSR